MNRRITTALLTTALLCAAPAALAQATSPITKQDQSIYDALYQKKLRSVDRTRSTADDLALAREMMGFAKDAPDSPGVQCLVYIDAITLAANGSDLSLMQQALTRLDEHWPTQDAISLDNILQRASQAYRAADRDTRIVVGEDYITLLLTIIQQYENQRDPEQALAVCKLANNVARMIDSGRLGRVGAILDRLTIESELASRIQMLTLSVKRNPKNAPVARELVKLLITKQNDPKAAAAYVKSTGDDELIDLVQRRNKGIRRATPATAMRVADWYLSLARDEEDRYAEPLLRDALAWHQHFLDNYPRKDALADRARSMIASAQSRLDRIADGNN